MSGKVTNKESLVKNLSPGSLEQRTADQRGSGSITGQEHTPQMLPGLR